jgi:hypothetical protein
MKKTLSTLIIILLAGCSQEKTDEKYSNLILQLVEDNKVVHTQDTGIPFRVQESKERIYRDLDARRVGVIDISHTHYLYMNVYQGQPCVVNMSISVVECFTEDGEIFQRFGMGRGDGPGELYGVQHFAITDSGYAILADGGIKQKIMNKNNNEILFNITLPFEPNPVTIGSVHNGKFAYAKDIYLNEPSIIYFEKQADGTWAKIIGSNLYDQNQPFRVSRETYDPMEGPPRDLIGLPHVFLGYIDGHSDGDFIISTMYSGLLLRMDDKKASWVRNLITNPMNGSINMTRSIPNLPDEYRPSYSPPMYYLPKPEGRKSYSYGMNVQNGSIINIGIEENAAGESGLILDFYDEGDGTYLYSYHFVAGTSITYLGIQLSGNRLYILNGNSEIFIFELNIG